MIEQSISVPPCLWRIKSFLQSAAAAAVGSAFDIQDEITELQELLSQIEAQLQDHITFQLFETYYGHELHLTTMPVSAAVCDAEDLVDELTMELDLWRKLGTNVRGKVSLFFLKRNPLATYGARLKKISSQMHSALTRMRDWDCDLVYKVEEQKQMKKRWRCFAVDETIAVMGILDLQSEGCPCPEPEVMHNLRWWETHAFRRKDEEEEKEFIVRDEDEEAIVQKLVENRNTEGEEEEACCVLPIIGFPGVGKTMFAKRVFWNDSVRLHFGRRFWVRVLDGFSTENVVEFISYLAVNMELKQQQQQNSGSEIQVEEGDDSSSTLGCKLQEALLSGEERCLIVVDGLRVADRDEWLRFNKLLRGVVGNGVQIIVTTWDRFVVMETTNNAPPPPPTPYIVLKGLSGLHSFRLAKAKRSSTWWRDCVCHCSGVPLGLKALAVGNHDIRNVFFQPDDSSMSKLFWRLKKVYDDLPLHLKHCFSFCSLFPRNHEFDRLSLIQMWMARGITVQLPLTEEEDTGNSYLKRLLQSCIFEDAQEDEFGTLKCFKMHTLMHDFAKLVARPNSSEMWKWADGDDLLAFAGHTITHFRSLVLPNQSKLGDEEIEHIKLLLDKSKCLRVLDLHCTTSIISIVGSIGIERMKHLRYLDLSENHHIVTLPRSITRLLNLQTLKLSNCGSLKELPKDIAKLVNLRHLHINGCWRLSHMPRGIGKLISLHTLSLYAVAKETTSTSTALGIAELSELEGLNSLRGGLELRHLNNARDTASKVKASKLKDKRLLETLRLVWEAADDDDDEEEEEEEIIAKSDEMVMGGLEPHPDLKGLDVRGYGSIRFPSWLSTPSNLIKITMSNCKRCLYLPPLHRFPHLKFLKLEKLSALQYIIITEEMVVPGVDSSEDLFFPCLEQLSLVGLPNLEGWFAGKKSQPSSSSSSSVVSFPLLSEVTIDDCSKLRSIPRFPCIEKLQVNKISKEQFESLLDSSNNNLKSLFISDIRDLDYLPERYLGLSDSLHNLEIRHCPNLLTLPALTSLRSLTLCSIQRLRSLSGWIDDLTSLETLKIKWCHFLELAAVSESSSTENKKKKKKIGVDLRWWPQLDLSSCQVGRRDCDSQVWTQLQNLRYLQMVGIPELVSLPEGLRLLTKLQSLELTACDGLTELPEWMGSLQSLQKLSLNYCPSLKSLPRALQNLTDLYKLKITGCPLLRERFGDGEGFRHTYNCERE